jgi:hypothetical protein
MPSPRRVKGPIQLVNLNRDRELSAEQVVQVANGEIKIFSEGEDAGITLPHKHRALFMSAVTLGYLKYSRKQTRVAEAFSCWCDARKIPFVSFEIDDDSLDMLSTNDSVENNDPIVTMHFDVATADGAFTRAGLLAVAELLLGHLWNLTLSPWKVSGGALPFSLARRMMVQVSKIWDATSERNAEGGNHPLDQESMSSGPQVIH